MLLSIYLSGVLFIMAAVTIYLCEAKVLRLSELFLFLVMLLFSWPAVLTIGILYFSDHLADKYSNPIVLDFRRIKKQNQSGIGNQNSVNKK